MKATQVLLPLFLVCLSVVYSAHFKEETSELQLIKKLLDILEKDESIQQQDSQSKISFLVSIKKLNETSRYTLKKSLN